MDDVRYVSRDTYEGRNQVIDERFDRDRERLDTQEAKVDKVQTLTIEMATLNKKHDDQLDKHEQRITCLERQPADQYSKLKVILTTAAVSAIAGYLFNAILGSVKP